LKLLIYPKTIVDKSLGLPGGTYLLQSYLVMMRFERYASECFIISKV